MCSIGSFAGADDHSRAERHLGDRALGRHGHAVAGRDGRAVDPEQVRAEQPPAGVLVGDAETLEGEDQRVDGELRQRQEADRVDLTRVVGRGLGRHVRRRWLDGLPDMIKRLSLGVDTVLPRAGQGRLPALAIWSTPWLVGRRAEDTT
jgi:hypothetical protein